MQHQPVRTFVVNAINKPHALRRNTLLVQPRIVGALQSWAATGRIVAYNESKKVTVENIGKIFASTEPGPKLEDLLQMFGWVVMGVRAFPLNIPRTAYLHALKFREKLEEIFKERMTMKKKTQAEGTEIDLLDGLMQVKDKEENKLSDCDVVDNIVSLIIGVRVCVCGFNLGMKPMVDENETKGLEKSLFATKLR